MTFKPNWDALGITTSFACAIHCAVLPLLISSLPVFDINIIENVMFENIMILLAFLICTVTLYRGFRKHHHNILPLIIFLAGLSMLIGKQAWHSFQLWFLIPPVVLICCSHVFNFLLCRKSSVINTENCDQ